MGRGALGGVLVGTMALLLAGAPGAQAGGAAVRYAEPGGDGPEPCLLADPCSLQIAVNGAPSGASVLMMPGIYIEGSTVTVSNNVDLRSQTGAVHDVIIASSASVAVRVLPGSSSSELEDFTIDHETGVAAGSRGLKLEGGIARRVYVDAGGSAQFACHVETSLLRDSICVNTATNGGFGAGMSTPSDLFPQLINVTAIATSGTGTGLFLAATAMNADPILTGRNVIAEGPLTDQGVSAVPGSSATVVLSNSNFDAVFALGSGGTETTTPNNVDGNQGDPELLGAGYRQLAGSPTIDAGDNGFAISAGDIDGDARIQGDAADIGADEFASPPPPPSTTPSTTITKKPKKKTTKRRAVFRFTSDGNPDTVGFECKLDGKPFKQCESGIVYKRLKRGKHVFRVRAVDPEAGRDPTPAKHRWKVVKK